MTIAHCFLGAMKIIDLTHTLTPDMPTWDGSCGFELSTILDHHECTTDTKFRLESFCMQKMGAGTHIDAPFHCFPDLKKVAELPLETLVVRAYVLDISHQASQNYLISAQDIIAFEAQHETIEPNSLFIAYTGWSRYWNNPEQYRNEDKHGIMHFPAYSVDAALLLMERNVAGIAIDTLSPDRPDSGYPVHTIVLSRGKYIVENIACADQLNPTGNFVVVLPLKLACAEAPVRILAFC